MVDELIQRITEPEAAASAASKSAARDALLAAAAAEDGQHKRKGLRVGGRGLALIAAVLAIPAGVAVATEIAGDEADFKSVAECPDLAAAIDAQGMDSEGLVLANCPRPGAEVENTVALLGKMQERRAALRDGLITPQEASEALTPAEVMELRLQRAPADAREALRGGASSGGLDDGHSPAEAGQEQITVIDPSSEDGPYGLDGIGGDRSGASSHDGEK